MASPSSRLALFTLSVLSITPVLMRRPSALVYLGALTSDGRRVTNACEVTGPPVPAIPHVPRDIDRPRRAALVKRLHDDEGWSLREISAASGFSKTHVARLLADPPSEP